MAQSAAGAVAAGVHGFVLALTSFVGRDGAVRKVEGLLEQHRLVTVTGPGGSGKTRMAGEVAGRMADRFADGAWLAELARVRDPAQVPAVVAAALGVREQRGIAMAEAMTRVLARQQVLLVLDNCEHVVDAAADLCTGLLLACDDVRVLATSREPLHVAGEARYRLAPLALPGPDDLTHATSADAVALFADRARSADAHFALDEQTGPVVARLVTRLDGMPLAIELAAAQVEALGVTQLLDLLDDRFDLLTTGDRLAAGRHRSLAATVEWSYRLLDEAERRVFRVVSVFRGPFTLEAAEAVAGPGAGPAVLHLVDCSLLVPPRTDADGRSRYVMLETLRAYGAEMLAETGEEAASAAALAGYALEMAARAAAGLRTTTAEGAAVRWLDAEDATTRQALAWTMDHDPDTALRLALELAPWWRLKGRFVTGYPLLVQAASGATPGSDAWCAAHYWLGRMASYAVGAPAALDHFTAVCDAIGDLAPSRVLADCLSGRSGVLANMGRIAEAAADGRRSLALARELGYPAGEARALVNLSVAAVYAGDPGAAVRHARQVQEITADIPGWIVRTSSTALTGALMDLGDDDAAERACAAGMAQARDAGDPWSLAKALTLMTDLDLRAGRLSDAAAHLREAFQLAVRTGNQLEMFNGLEICALLCVATGRYAEAITAWAARAALVRQRGLADPPSAGNLRDKPMARARQVLGDERVRAAEDRGAAMSLATAAEYALMLVSPDPQAHPPAGLVGLSARERELVTLVARGLTDAQIAARLFISPRTVHSHLDRIRDKTGARRRADLTRLALAAGLV